MKKIVLLLTTMMFMMPVNSVLAVDSEVEESTETELQVDEESRALYVFADDFPEDYTKWTQSVYANRIIYAMEQYFGITIEEEEIEISQNGESVVLYPQELLDGRGNQMGIYVSPDQVNIFMTREWEDYAEKEKYAVAFMEMLGDVYTREENMNYFAQFQQNVDNYIEVGFPLEVQDTIANQQAYISHPGFESTEFSSANLIYTNAEAVYNNNVVFAIGYYDEADYHTDFEEEGTYHFPAGEDVEASAEKELPYIYVDDPQFVEYGETTDLDVPAELIPEDYMEIDYQEIMDNSDEVVGVQHTFEAEVLQVQEDGDLVYALLMRDGDANMIYQAIYQNLPENQLFEGDIVEVYGGLIGIESYRTVEDVDNITPVIYVYFTEVLQSAN